MKISQKWKVGTYTLSHKVSHLMVVNNFGKYRPIFKILSPIDSEENSLCRPITTKISTSRAIGCYTTLWKSKIQKKCYWFWQHPQRTADTFVVTLWTFDLTFNSSQCLKLDCWHWLIDWSSSDDVLNQSTVNVVQLNVIASWICFTMIIFVPSSFFLGYTSMWHFGGRLRKIWH